MTKVVILNRLQDNADKFIAEMKMLPFPFESFGRKWADNNWPHFTFSRSGVKSKRISRYTPDELLPPTIIEFSKAWGVWCITQYNLNATQFALHVAPLKLIELALKEEGLPINVSNLNETVYDRCLNLIKSHHRGLGQNTAQYHLNKFIQWLNSRVGEEQLILRHISTRQPYRGNRPYYVDTISEEISRSKIPDNEVLMATSEIFSIVMPSISELKLGDNVLRYDKFEERYISSICALLMLEPARYGDIFLLERDCFIEKTNTEGKVYSALRYRGSKGHPDFHKGIPSVAAPLIKHAITWLQHMSEPGIVLVRFYENPNTALRKLLAGTAFKAPKHLQISKPVTLWELGGVIGVYDSKPKSENLHSTWEAWIAMNHIALGGSYTEISTNLAAVALNVSLRTLRTLNLPSPLTLRALQEFWVNRQQNFLGDGYRYHLGAKHKGNGKRAPLSSALILPIGSMTGGGIPHPDMISDINGAGSSSALSLTYVNVSTWFTRRIASKEHINIFRKMGYPEHYSINSHGFRHWLNTAGQEQGMSDSLIALWSGRASMKTNFVYDNKTENERHEHNLSVIGTENEKANIIVVPANITEFREKTSRNGMVPTLTMPDEVDENGEPITSFIFKSAHRMRTGYCVQPLELVPCDKLEGLDCIGCSKSCHVKGDMDDLHALQEDHAIQAHRLRAAIKRKATGILIDDRWLATHERRYVKRSALLSLLTDDGIEKGAVIRPVKGKSDQYLVSNPAMTQSVTMSPHLPNFRKQLELEGLTRYPIQKSDTEVVNEFCPDTFLSELMELSNGSKT